MQITGKVIPGESVGRTIGFPTANLDMMPSESELKLGVYIGSCQIDQAIDQYRCLIYFGPRFIFGETRNNFEVFLYDFNGDLYGKTLTVSIGQFIRPPMKMSNLDELKSQLQKDQKQGRLLFNDQSKV